MLKRDITTINLLIVSATSMIGSGWLFSPLVSAQMAGPDALISWVIAALFMILIALPLCEIGTMFPISGGMANYPILTHGREVGFLFAWMSWLSFIVVAPIETQAVLQYASHFFPKLVNHPSSSELQLSSIGYMTAFCILSFITLLNIFGIKFLAECSKYAGLFKFIVPSLTIFTLLYTAGSMTHNVSLGFHTQNWINIFSALSSGGVAFAFLGFQTGLMLSGEAKNPQRDIPFAMLGSILFAFVLYFLLQLSFIVSVPSSYLAQGWSHLTFPGIQSPLVGLTLLLGLGTIATLLLIDSSISPLGTGLVYATGASRILFSMALNQYLPQKFLLKLNHFKVPYVALIINLVVGMCSFLPFPGWQKMMTFLSSICILSYIVGPVCTLGMRQLEPLRPRPFRLPCATVVCYLSFYACNLMLHWCNFETVWKLYVALLVGFIIHFFHQKKWNTLKNRSVQWFFLYMTALLLFSYLGPFGGIAVLSFPYDMLLLMPISFLMFYLSQKCLSPGHTISEF